LPKLRVLPARLCIERCVLTRNRDSIRSAVCAQR